MKPMTNRRRGSTEAKLAAQQHTKPFSLKTSERAGRHLLVGTGRRGKRAALPQRVRSPPSVQAGLGLKLLIPASIHDSLQGFKMSSAGKCVLPQRHMFFSLMA